MTLPFLAALLSGMAILPAALAGAPEELAPVLKKAAGWDSYGFTVESQPSPGVAGALEGRYQKDRPLYCKADRIEFFKKGAAIAYKDGDRWLRSKTGIMSDPLRVLGAVAKVNAVRVPHEELAALATAAGAIKKEKEKDGGNTVYNAELNAETARSLARPEHRGVAQGGTARFWVGGDGKLVKYVVSIRVQGRMGGAEVDGTVVKTVTLSKVGSTEVEVPEGARKVLE